MDSRWRFKRLYALHWRIQLKMHPLLPDLAELKEQEIHSKINDLTKKYFLSRNPDVQRQIAQILDTLRYELSERNRRLWEEQMKDKSLDNLIKVS